MYNALRGGHEARPERNAFVYMKSGHEVIRSVQNILDTLGRPARDVRSILDFACGYGRVTRFLKHAFPHARVTCSDILEEAVTFASRKFRVKRKASTTRPEAFVLRKRFDLILVSSLFSHLPPGSVRGLATLVSTSS